MLPPRLPCGQRACQQTAPGGQRAAPRTAHLHAPLAPRPYILNPAMQGLVREIVRHGATAVRVDGPYGGPRPIATGSDPPYMLLIAGGIGVRTGPKHAGTQRLADRQLADRQQGWGFTPGAWLLVAGL